MAKSSAVRIRELNPGAARTRTRVPITARHSNESSSLGQAEKVYGASNASSMRNRPPRRRIAANSDQKSSVRLFRTSFLNAWMPPESPKLTLTFG